MTDRLNEDPFSGRSVGQGVLVGHIRRLVVGAGPRWPTPSKGGVSAGNTGLAGFRVRPTCRCPLGQSIQLQRSGFWHSASSRGPAGRRTRSRPDRFPAAAICATLILLPLPVAVRTSTFPRPMRRWIRVSASQRLDLRHHLGLLMPSRPHAQSLLGRIAHGLLAATGGTAR